MAILEVDMHSVANSCVCEVCVNTEIPELFGLFASFMVCESSDSISDGWQKIHNYTCHHTFWQINTTVQKTYFLL